MSVTIMLVGITVLVSLGAFNNGELFQKLLHSPYIESREKEYYRFISSGFVHVDMMHLFINMFVMWQFGSIVEQYYQSGFGKVNGGLLFLAMYLGSIAVGDIPSFMKHKDNSYYTAVGASGGVSGIMLAYVIFDPWSMIYLFGVVPIPTIIAAVLYLGYSSYAAKKAQDNIGHDAHFYGAVFGFLFTILASPDFLNHFLIRLQNDIPF